MQAADDDPPSARPREHLLFLGLPMGGAQT